MPFPHFSLPTLAADHDSAVNYGNRHHGVNSAFVSEKLRNIRRIVASVGNDAGQRNDVGGRDAATASAGDTGTTDAIRCRGRAIAPADGQPLAGRAPGGTGTNGAAPASRPGGRAPGAPTATELASIAVAHSDFIGDLDAVTLTANAENSAYLAADIWTDTHDRAVPLAAIVEARRLLVEHGYLVLCEREQAELDALVDGVDAGDLEPDGTPIPYPQYRSA